MDNMASEEILLRAMKQKIVKAKSKHFNTTKTTVTSLASSKQVNECAMFCRGTRRKKNTCKLDTVISYHAKLTYPFGCHITKLDCFCYNILYSECRPCKVTTVLMVGSHYSQLLLLCVLLCIIWGTLIKP